jgi:hypothetical protein
MAVMSGLPTIAQGWEFNSQGVATWIPPEQRLNYANFASLPKSLRGMNTHVVLLPPNGSMFNLAGPNAGREGARLASQVLGDQSWPFDLVITESPYLMGAIVERVNIKKREFNVGVVIGNHAPPMTEYQYRMAEAHWWAGQDEAQDGWLGIYTRFSGWRWIPVRPSETVKTPQKVDNTAYGNNVSQWDLMWMAARPYFTKPALFREWSASTAGMATTSDVLDEPVYKGILPLANRGDLPSYVSYYVSSPGTAVVMDNAGGTMVPLPTTQASDGNYWCDTEPSHRTLTAASDPVDNPLYKYLRSSVLLDFLLHKIDSLGLPLQLRFDRRFVYSVPPNTVVTLKVEHTDPNGRILAVMPQRFKRSR